MGLVTPLEARNLYGIPTHRVYLWRNRGTITPAGFRGRSALYRANQLVELNQLADLDPRSKHDR